MAFTDVCKIRNTNNGKTLIADVLSRSDKSLRVVIPGIIIPLTLTRKDLRGPFVVQTKKSRVFNKSFY
jgi:hypothetical protein